MFTDIDGWAAFLWIVLFPVALFSFWSDSKNHAHTVLLLCTAPAILVYMAMYTSVRTLDRWCVFWGAFGIMVSAPIAVIALARMTAHYVSRCSESNELHTLKHHLRFVHSTAIRTRTDDVGQGES